MAEHMSKEDLAVLRREGGINANVLWAHGHVESARDIVQKSALPPCVLESLLAIAQQLEAVRAAVIEHYSPRAPEIKTLKVLEIPERAVRPGMNPIATCKRLACGADIVVYDGKVLKNRYGPASKK